MSEQLTNKQEAFVLALIEGKSQREAYKSAYNASNMKDSTIDERACCLFAQNKIRARYDELQAKVRAQGEKQAVATAVEVLEELSNIGLGRKKYPTYDMYGNPFEKLPTVKDRLKALELLGRKHGLFTDRVDVTGALPVIIKDDIPDED